MRNRAKCKKCGSIIESFHRFDYVACSCGEIAIEGGTDFLRTYAHDFSNFLRVDNDGREAAVTFKNKDNDEDDNNRQNPPEKATKQDLLQEFHRLVENLEKLPEQALSMPVSHYDLYSFMLILSSILRSER